MATRPHDLPDLFLAPVVLAIDARIEELARLDARQLAFEIALESDTPDFTRQLREESLIRTIEHLIDTHYWTLSLDPRGLRVTHDAHTLVLGLPATLREYVEGAPA